MCIKCVRVCVGGGRGCVKVSGLKGQNSNCRTGEIKEMEKKRATEIRGKEVPSCFRFDVHVSKAFALSSVR